MTWYAAHIILLTKFLDGVQDSYPIWENIVLINAETSDDAHAIADKKGLTEAEVPGRRCSLIVTSLLYTRA